MKKIKYFNWIVLGISLIITLLSLCIEKRYGIIVSTIQAIGLAVFAVIIIISFCKTDEPKKSTLKKLASYNFFAIPWFCSCIMIVDNFEFSWANVIRYLTSYVFIYMGCMLPEFILEIQPDDKNERHQLLKRLDELEKKNKQLEERISALEK